MQIDHLFKEAQDLHQRGQLGEALKRYERLLKLAPEHAPARIFRALLLQQSGKSHEALIEAEQALTAMAKPDLAVLINYGVIQKNAGRLDAAARAYERALELAPNTLSAQSNLATLYLMLGRLDEAETRFQALAQRMEEPAPWLNLARIAMMKQRFDEARHCLQRAEDFDSTHPDVQMLKARLASSDKDFASAFVSCIKGLKRTPAHRELWQILQGLDAEVFDLEELESCLNALAKGAVQSATVLSTAVDLCRKHWLWHSLPKLEAMLAESLLRPLDKVPSSSDMFTLLGANVPQRAHLAASKPCWQALTKGLTPLPPREVLAKAPGEKLRVGVLSSDLRGHAIGYLVVGFFEHLPKEHIEWWAYHNVFDDDSHVRERLRSHFDRSINIARLNDAELAERIRADGIDVLIDLNQWTALTRVTTMAARPAPIQIQWLGMPGTLGAGKDVDYILVDPWVVDASNADGFSECLLQLPRSYQPNDHVAPDIGLCPDRAAAGLPAEALVLGVFNQYYKFSPDTFALWADILRQLPTAVLWLLEPGTAALRARVEAQARRQGIDPGRIIFAPRKPQNQHLARLQWMDLVLDTWPYNAHTTASDALRVGVPVLTLPQQTFASRVATGILATAGLHEWIATSAQDYVARAVAFGRQPRASIDATKAAIKTSYWASPMVDNAALGRLFAAMLSGLYARAVAGEAPTSLRLEQDGRLSPLPFGRQAGEEADTAAESEDSKLQPLVGAATDKLPAWCQQLVRGGNKARFSNLAVLQQVAFTGMASPHVLDAACFPPGSEGYELYADAGLLHSLRLESDPATYAKVKEQAKPQRQIRGAVLGDGKRHPWHQCQASDLSSLLRPHEAWLAQYPGYSRWGRVQQTLQADTLRLDDLLAESGAADPYRLLYLDARGSDLLVLEQGSAVLAELALLQVKCAVTPLYEGGATLFGLGQWLATQGYVLHTLVKENKRCMLPYGNEETPFAGRNQLVQVEAVFIPDPLQWSQLSSARLLALAWLAHALHRSYDLSLRALTLLDTRDQGKRADSYQTYLDVAGLEA